MRTLLISTTTALVLALAGCGDSDGGDGSAGPSSEPASATTDVEAGGGLTVTDGTTPDELVECLTGAGLTATATDTTMMGVEVPHAQVEVTDLEGYDGPGTQNADLWVFADPAAAADNAPYLTLGGSDDPEDTRFAVAGNVVLTFWVVTDTPPTADEVAARGCLPG